MLFSVFTLFSLDQQLPGDVLHIPRAQDLLLMSFYECCEVQLASCVSLSRAEFVEHGLKPFAKMSVCEEEEFVSVNPSVIIHSLLV